MRLRPFVVLFPPVFGTHLRAVLVRHTNAHEARVRAAAHVGTEALSVSPLDYRAARALADAPTLLPLRSES